MQIKFTAPEQGEIKSEPYDYYDYTAVDSDYKKGGCLYYVDYEMNINISAEKSRDVQIGIPYIKTDYIL